MSSKYSTLPHDPGKSIILKERTSWLECPSVNLQPLLICSMALGAKPHAENISGKLLEEFHELK